MDIHSDMAGSERNVEKFRISVYSYWHRTEKLLCVSEFRQVDEIEKSGRSGAVKVSRLSAKRDFRDVRGNVRAYRTKIYNISSVKVYTYGNCKRDFTYIDDIVEGVVRVLQKAPKKKNGEDGLPLSPYKVYNIGNQNPENLLDFVDILQQEPIRADILLEDYDFDAHKELVPMQPGDVPVTYADTSALEADFGYKPSTSLREGLRKFAEWYAEFYK